jgi:hypothetical protein
MAENHHPGDHHRASRFRRQAGANVMAENFLFGAGDRSAIQILSEDVIGERNLLGAGDRSASDVLANDIFRTRATGEGYSYLTPDWVRDSDGGNGDLVHPFNPDGSTPTAPEGGFSVTQKAILALGGIALFSALVGQLFTFEVGS